MKKDYPVRQQHAAITNLGQLYDAVAELNDFRSKTQFDSKTIAMFSFGRLALIVGDDADKLYFELGWDFANCPTEDEQKPIHYILVSPQGRQSLHNASIRIVPMSSKYELSFIVDDIVVSLAQQQLDYLRSNVRGKGIEYVLFDEYVFIQLDGYIRKACLSALHIDELSVSVILDGKELFTIANGKDWSLANEGRELLLSVDGLIERHKERIYSLVTDCVNVKKTQRINNKSTYLNFIDASKRRGEDEILLVNEKGILVSFDDDALLLHSKVKARIYLCHIMGMRDHTVAVISNGQFQAIAEEEQINFHVISPQVKRDFYDFGFVHSVLSLDARADVSFKKISICKSADGNFYIQASTTEGKELKQAVVPYELGLHYSSLPQGKEKSAYQTAIAHLIYDKTID